MIRKFIKKDTDAVVKSWRAASELAHPFLKPEFLDSEADALRNVYLKYAETWVMEIEGTVVGFVALSDNEVAGLFVCPEHHGQGLGSALIDKAVAEKGALSVEVFKENLIGRRFYDRYGFHGCEEFHHEPSDQVTIKLAYTP